MSHRRPVVGPRLRRLLIAVLAIFALLCVNSFYLGSITLMEWLTGQNIQGYLYQWMFLLHLALGLLIVLPLLAYAALHARNAHGHRNRRAVKAGYALAMAALLLLCSGLLLTRGIAPLELKDPATRAVSYWTHIATPFLVIWLFVLHRLAGPSIRWRVGGAVATGMVVLSVSALVLERGGSFTRQEVDTQSFTPSLATTADGRHIPADSLMMDGYCSDCHADVHASWSQSMHRFSSFNNPAYRFSVDRTRRFLEARDGTGDGVRFCAGCHDPVPMFSGELDAADFGEHAEPSATAGITCTVCHSITSINSPRGNADYTLTAPRHYPFAASERPVLRWINATLIKAKPDFHRRSFMKPLHTSAEFCGTCHKVHLPESLNAYRWLRGQNHYDSYLLSGVSGHSVQSFYYPESAHPNCNGCHMPFLESDDFGARRHMAGGDLSVHDHQFAAANTAIPHMLGLEESVWKRSEAMLRDSLRVDIFAIREEGRIDGRLHAPLEEAGLALAPGGTYLVEVVLRTLTPGHHFTQGTADSNEVWLSLQLQAGEQILGQSGALQRPERRVDPQAHFVNSYVIDSEGRRIDRRNPENIHTTLYNNQIPPGAADVVHYRIQIPEELPKQPLSLAAVLSYRKFDTDYLRFIQGDRFKGNDLPIVAIASARLGFGRGGDSPPQSRAPRWQRWNDYGIGLLRRRQFRQAEEAFREVEALGRGTGALNLARVYLLEGRLEEAGRALERAGRGAYPAPPWTISYFTAQLNLQNGYIDEAIIALRDLAATRFSDARARGFDFASDYRLLNDLALALSERAKLERRTPELAAAFRREAVSWYRKTLALDPENATAHYAMAQLFEQLGKPALAVEHRKLHALYRVDDNARDRAVQLSRGRDPAADKAANMIPIYDLKPVNQEALQTP